MNLPSPKLNLPVVAGTWRRSAAPLDEASLPGTEEILEQLSRMLNDELFVRSERLSRFLRFIVEQALQGRVHQLNQYAVGLAAFDKSPSFDPNIDPIVRVEAGRLRAKLREYYATSGQIDRVRIGMAKSGYRPVFRRWPPAPVPSEPASKADHRREVPRSADSLSNGGHPSVFGRPALAIAILPFSNLSRDAASDQFCRAISGQMSVELAQLTSSSVHVVTPIVDPDSGSSEIAEIGRRYNAEVVLEGSLQTVRRHVRIFSMLARTSDASGIWAHSYDGSFDDLCSQQSKTLHAIAEDVARALQLEKARKPIVVA